jgi:hypothetical protein
MDPSHPIFKSLPSLKREIRELLISIKKDQDWKQLRADFAENSDDETPHIQVTIGCTFDYDEGTISWNYQTGDNSYSGGAYGHPEWFIVYLTPRANCYNEAKDIIGEIEGRIHECFSALNNN